jgi:hypothetical protein
MTLVVRRLKTVLAFHAGYQDMEDACLEDQTFFETFELKEKPERVNLVPVRRIMPF